MANRDLLRLLVVAVLLLGMASPASARLYLGLGAAYWELDDRGQREWSDFALGGLVGVRINRNISVESRLIKGGSDTDLGRERELEWAHSTLVRPVLPLGYDSNLYVLVGVTSFRFSSGSGGPVWHATELEPTFGAGYEFMVGRRSFFGVEYVQYSGTSRATFRSVNAGLRWQFE